MDRPRRHWRWGRRWRDWYCRVCSGKGSIVYLNGVNGEKPTIAKAIATGDGTSAETIGWVENDINNNADGYVTTFGILNNVNTQAYADGDYLYLSGTTAGGYTATKPYAPTHNVTVGFVVKGGSVGAGQVFVLIKNGFELEELHDVQVNGAASGTYLKWNGSLWVADDQVVTLTGTQTVTNKTLTDPKVGGSIIIDNNVSTPISASGALGTVLHAVNEDGFNTRILIDTHGNGVHSSYTNRKTRGSAASPTAVQSGDNLGEFTVRGYGETGFSSASDGRLVFYANQNFTDANHGVKAVIEVAPNGSVNAAEALAVTSSALNIPTGSTYKINGTDVLSSSALGTGVTSSSLTTVGTLATGTWQASTIAIEHGGTGATSASSAINNLLPVQTGNNGEFLKTDGTNVSWTTLGDITLDGGGA